MRRVVVSLVLLAALAPSSEAVASSCFAPDAQAPMIHTVRIGPSPWLAPLIPSREIGTRVDVDVADHPVMDPGSRASGIGSVAIDVDDGAYTAEMSPRDGRVGGWNESMTHVIAPDRLLPGFHTIVLTATDRCGNVATESIEFVQLSFMVTVTCRGQGPSAC